MTERDLNLLEGLAPYLVLLFALIVAAGMVAVTTVAGWIEELDYRRLMRSQR